MFDNKNVFTPGRIPDLTYNKRENENLEQKVKFKLDVGGQIVILSGPSKIGKTVLINKVIDKKTVVVVQGGEIKSESDLEILILQKLSKLPAEQQKIEQIQTSGNITSELNAKTPFWLHVGAKIGIKFTAEKSDTIKNTYIDSPFDRAISYMIEQSYVLVIDDFHYIQGEIQKNVIRKLKSPLSEGLRVLFALIPSRSEVVVQTEPDMQSRTSVINIPRWSNDELEYIPRRGFDALGVNYDCGIINELVSNSFHNPYLMQQLCSQLMFEYNISSKRDRKILCNIEFDKTKFQNIYKELLSDDLTIRSLEKGQQQRGRDRSSYKFPISESNTIIVDLYKIIIIALGAQANDDVIDIKDLVDTIQAMGLKRVKTGSGDMPRTSDITGTLNKISKKASEINKKDPVIEYKENERRVYMYDSFFSFNLRMYYNNIFNE